VWIIILKVDCEASVDMDVSRLMEWRAAKWRFLRTSHWGAVSICCEGAEIEEVEHTHGHSGAKRMPTRMGRGQTHWIAKGLVSVSNSEVMGMLETHIL
jgi:hypothetical protein